MSIRDKIHIMVVDDMSTSRGLITQSLDDLGIKNYTYEASGEEAYKKLSMRPVHLVLSDYHMPGMDGLSLLHELRKNPKTQKIAFVMITGSPTPDVVNKGKALRINSILKKPFSTDQIRDCIERIVGRL